MPIDANLDGLLNHFFMKKWRSGGVRMKLMISVLSAVEAQDVIAGGTAILDIKNPAEGSLGAQPPRVIREII
jgi:hypothetical protein